MGYLRPYVRKYGVPALLAVACVAAEAAADLLQPTIMARIVDVGVATRDVGYVLAQGAVMLMVAGLGGLAATARNLLASTVSQRFAADLRADLYRCCVGMSFATLDRFETASLVTRITNDVTQMQNFVNGMMRIFVKAPLLAIGAVIMAFLLDARLARILVVMVPVVAALVAVSLRVGYPRYRAVQQRLDRVNGVFREYLAGVRVVKAFNRFDYEAVRFSAANDALAGANAGAMRIMAVFTPGIAFSVNLAILGVLWLGGVRVDAGEVGAGQVIAFVNYMTLILFSLMIVAFIFNTFVRARASSERISQVLSAGATPAGASTDERLNRRPGEPHARRSGVAASSVTAATGASIRFESVGFRYGGEGSLAALQNVSFECRAGATLGIIGSTGAGKSTLVDLIPRFREAQSGRVSVGGVDVRSMDTAALREQVAVVPQRTLLFTGTIGENIRWGREDADMAAVIAAAHTAQAHDFISSLRDGYDTRLGRGGLNLSGGQKQRVALARALVRRPRILILDDCASALDAVTEQRLRAALARDLEGATLVLVAQRVASVVGAERILVLEEGVIAGLGTHPQLLASCEVYADIHRSQIGVAGESHG